MGSVTVRNVPGRGWVVDLSNVVDGKRKRIIKTFGRGAKAKQAADEYRDQQASELKTGKYWERREMTFRHLWESFESHELLDGALAPATIEDYKCMARLYLLPLLGKMKLNEIKVHSVKDLKAKLLTEPGAKAAGKEGSGKPLSPRTVEKILTLLGSVFRYGDDSEDSTFVTGNPAANVKKPRAPKKEVHILDPEEIARLRAAVDDPVQSLMLDTEILSALRSGEIRGLRWASIDLKGKRIFVRRQATRRRSDDKTKTESSVRTVPIAEVLIPRLERWKLECPATPEGLVFPGEPDANGMRKPLAADHLLRNVLRPALKKAGLPALRFQDLRHLACTLMAEAGVPPKQAQAVMGHADIMTTMRIYTHVMSRRHSDVADRIAAFAGLTLPGNMPETSGSVTPEE